MEVRVRERLIGALVLVAIVVLLVPAILKGRAPAPAEPPPAQSRRVEMPVGNEMLAADDVASLPDPDLTTDLPQSGAPLPTPTPTPTPDPLPPAATLIEAPAKAPTAAPKSAAPEDPTAKPAPKRLPDPAPIRTAPPAGGTAWAVQLGAFSSRDKADQLVATLKKRGYAAFVLEYRASGKVLYRVRVGPEQDRSRSEATAARLAKDGYQPVVARHP